MPTWAGLVLLLTRAIGVRAARGPLAVRTSFAIALAVICTVLPFAGEFAGDPRRRLADD